MPDPFISSQNTVIIVPQTLGAVLWNRHRYRGSCESAQLLTQNAAALSQINLLRNTFKTLDDITAGLTTINNSLAALQRLKVQFLWRVGLTS